MAKSAAPIQIADAWLALVGRAVGIAIVTCAVSDIALVWTKIRVTVLARALAQIHNIKHAVVVAIQIVLIRAHVDQPVDDTFFAILAYIKKFVWRAR